MRVDTRKKVGTESKKSDKKKKRRNKIGTHKDRERRVTQIESGCGILWKLVQGSRCSEQRYS